METDRRLFVRMVSAAVAAVVSPFKKLSAAPVERLTRPKRVWEGRFAKRLDVPLTARDVAAANFSARLDVGRRYNIDQLQSLVSGASVRTPDGKMDIATSGNDTLGRHLVNYMKRREEEADNGSPSALGTFWDEPDAG